MKAWYQLIASVVAFTLIFATPSEARRVALVIGNSAYKTVGELDNPRNDARDIAKTLKSIGFDEVDLYEDLSYRDLRIALRRFLRSSRGADVSLIYYAGHSIEVDNSNYLIPIDAKLELADDIEFEAIRLDQVRAAASGASQVRIIILDACRNNPFKVGGRSSTRSVGRGLAKVEAGKNELIAYAAKDGSLASDGEGTRNSPFTTALLRHIKTPGLELSMMFRRVKAEVLKATNNAQEPYTYASLSPDPIYLNSMQPKQKPVSTQQFIRVAPSYDQQAELMYWNTVKDSKDTAVLKMYLSQYPKGKFATLARLLIANLDRSKQKKAVPVAKPALTVPVSKKSAAKDIALTQDLIKEIQGILYDLNYDVKSIDGVLGSRTRIALSKFQDNRKISKTTLDINRATLEALRGAERPRPWGTISYSSRSKSWGASWGHDTRREAEQEANRVCNHSTCKPYISFHSKACGAFAYSAQSWSIKKGSSISQAKEAALNSCQKGQSKCKLIKALCASEG